MAGKTLQDCYAGFGKVATWQSGRAPVRQERSTDYHDALLPIDLWMLPELRPFMAANLAIS